MLPVRPTPLARHLLLLCALALLLAGCGGGGGGGSGTQPPVARSSTFTTIEDTPGAGFFNTTIAPGRTPNYTIVQNGTSGTAEVTDHAAGEFTYTPNAGFTGSDAFTFKVNDGSQDSNVAVVSVAIVKSDLIASDDIVSIYEDTPVTVHVLANDSGFGHVIDPASVTLASPPARGLAAVNANGSITYTPADNANGSDSFTYTVDSFQGQTDTATVIILITPVNDAPVAANDAFVVAEDSTTTLSVLADNGHGADSDVDGDTLTIIGVSRASQGGNLSLTSNQSALFYTPAANFFGTETFTYTIGDGQGGSDTATVTVTVTPVNDDPVAADDAFTVAEDSTTVLSVLADNGNGADTDIEGDPFAITAVGAPSQGGNAAINGAGNGLIYTPAANFFGVETFSYTISDGQGGVDSAVVTMTVTAVNDAPVAQDDAFSVTMNSSSNVLAVLADNGNGADMDVDIDAITITSVGTPDNGGTVEINVAQDTLTYTPPAGFIGIETFTYTISDGNGGTDTATAAINTFYYDNFSGGTGAWTFVDDSNLASAWTTVSGALRQQNRVESINAFEQSYHKGTYALYTTGMSLTDYRFSVDAIFLATTLADDIGIMFRYQNNDNYYRLTMNSRYGFTRVEKKVAGTYIPLAVNAMGYDSGQLLNFTIEVNGSLIQIWINNDPMFAIEDSSLSSGSVALYTQDRASFDNARIEGPLSSPTVVLGTPVAHTVETTNLLTATAIATSVPAGGGVEFVLDGTESALDTTYPYGTTFSGLSQGDHIVEAIVRGPGNEELARDTNTLLGVLGEYFVAFGDSIMNGSGDNFAADNQNGRILGFQGLAANLADLLEASLNKPVIVYNEGIGGDESADTAFIRVDSIVARHPGGNNALVMLGTNDALASIPSGTGCSGIACDGTFKGNMQSLVGALTAAGNSLHVAIPPPIFGLSSPFSNPSGHVTNSRIREYGSVIANELSNTQDGPDFYDYFLGAGINRFSLFADVWHPNALGHRVMAYLWHNAVNPGSPVSLPFVLGNLAPSTTSPYLKQNLLEIGDVYYVDRSYALTGIPTEIANGIWVMTANNDASNSSSSYITFDLDRPATVLIAYDAGAASLPNWMSAYANTGLTLGTNDPLSPTLNLYSRSYGAGSVVLGGNMANGASGANSNYIAIVVSN